MSEISGELRVLASAMATEAGSRTEAIRLLRRAADALDASDLETLWMWERLRTLVQTVEVSARRKYGPSRATFLAEFAKGDPAGSAAWKGGHEVMLATEIGRSGYSIRRRPLRNGRVCRSSEVPCVWFAVLSASSPGGGTRTLCLKCCRAAIRLKCIIFERLRRRETRRYPGGGN
jgi:hypothetical protein